jgi:colanic acid/amylovoran biosynthesis glycosyltransferase
MKIAFIVNAFPILSETFVLNQITGLLDRGHDVDIFAVHPQGQPVVHADVERYHLLERTYYRGTLDKRMPQDLVLRFMKAVRLVAKNLHRNPIALLRALNVFEFGRKAASLRILYEVMPFLENGMASYDIISCHFGPNGKLGVLLKRIGIVKGKVLTTIHGGYDMPMYIMDRGNDAYDDLFEYGDLLLPISNRWKTELIRLGCKGEKIIVHRMGVDTSKFIFSSRQPRHDGRVQLLTVARLVEKKGVEYGIRAVARVLPQHPQVEYEIAGDGPLKGDISRLISNLDVTDNVKLLGWRRQEEILELMQEADILLAPSVCAKDGDWEGIPVVLMEALALGLPVISTQHSGIPELVQDGESGFLVPERDVDALTEKLEFLIQHQEIWPEMGRAGRDFVERYYDIGKLNDQLVNLYERLLDGELPRQ